MCEHEDIVTVKLKNQLDVENKFWVLVMPGFFLHVGATIMCPHGGQVSLITSNTQVFVDKKPVATQNDAFLVAGCPFPGPSLPPHPCVVVRWLVPATRVLVNGQPVVLRDSTGICQSADQTPQGPPNVIVTQIRVKGI